MLLITDSYTVGTGIMPSSLNQGVEYAKKMMEKGVYVVAFSYPVVAKGRARIRTQVCASHTKEDIDFVIQCLKESREEIGK